MKHLLFVCVGMMLLTSCSGSKTGDNSDSNGVADSARIVQSDSVVADSASVQTSAAPEFKSDDLKALGLYDQVKSRKINVAGNALDGTYYIEPTQEISFSPEGKSNTQPDRLVSSKNKDGIFIKYEDGGVYTHYWLTYTELNDRNHPVKARYEIQWQLPVKEIADITYSDYAYDNHGNWTSRTVTAKVVTEELLFDEEGNDAGASKSSNTYSWTEKQVIEYY